MNEKPARQVDFICPFKDGAFHCPEIMSPMRDSPSNRERKLFVMMNKELAPTKNGCPRCTVFVTAWKEHIGTWGHLRYFVSWFLNKKIRASAPQEQL